MISDILFVLELIVGFFMLIGMLFLPVVPFVFAGLINKARGGGYTNN